MSRTMQDRQALKQKWNHATIFIAIAATYRCAIFITSSSVPIDTAYLVAAADNNAAGCHYILRRSVWGRLTIIGRVLPAWRFADRIPCQTESGNGVFAILRHTELSVLINWWL
jgi:hypothetical protein